MQARFLTPVSITLKKGAPQRCGCKKDGLEKDAYGAQREKLQECLILRLFVMDRQFGHHHKACPPYKLALLLTPLCGLLVGVKRNEASSPRINKNWCHSPREGS